jgi:hypothetical protein
VILVVPPPVLYVRIYLKYFGDKASTAEMVGNNVGAYQYVSQTPSPLNILRRKCWPFHRGANFLPASSKLDQTTIQNVYHSRPKCRVDACEEPQYSESWSVCADNDNGQIIDTR